MKKVILAFCALTVLSLEKTHAEKLNLNLDEIKQNLFQGAIGDKKTLIILDFWASWCGPCRESMPFYQELSEKYKDISVIGISEDDSLDDAKSFAQKEKIKFALSLDKKHKLADSLKIESIPVTLVLNSKLEVIEKVTGFRKEKKLALEKRIQEEIKKAPEAKSKDSTPGA